MWYWPLTISIVFTKYILHKSEINSIKKKIMDKYLLMDQTYAVANRKELSIKKGERITKT